MGTTLGMMLADVPAVYLGDIVANRIPLKLVRGIAAAIFIVDMNIRRVPSGRASRFTVHRPQDEPIQRQEVYI